VRGNTRGCALADVPRQAFDDTEGKKAVGRHRASLKKSCGK
jgi:hypothetical protein